MTQKSRTTAANHKLFRGLERQVHPLPSEDEVAGPMPTPEPEMLSDEVAWLDRYLFDREWRWRQR